MEIDINGIITISAVIAYVIVFFIQKAQMDKQKEIVIAMKTFVDIFKVDEVKKYVEMREERILDNAARVVLEKPEMKKITDDLMEKIKIPKKEFYDTLITENTNELMNVCFGTALNQKKELREGFINDYLPRNKVIIQKMIDDFEQNTP